MAQLADYNGTTYFLPIFENKGHKVIAIFSNNFIMLHSNTPDLLKCEFLYLCNPFGIENFLLVKNIVNYKQNNKYTISAIHFSVVFNFPLHANYCK
jgi:hypothetical protein